MDIGLKFEKNLRYLLSRCWQHASRLYYVEARVQIRVGYTNYRNGYTDRYTGIPTGTINISQSVWHLYQPIRLG